MNILDELNKLIHNIDKLNEHKSNNSNASTITFATLESRESYISQLNQTIALLPTLENKINNVLKTTKEIQSRELTLASALINKLSGSGDIKTHTINNQSNIVNIQNETKQSLTKSLNKSLNKSLDKQDETDKSIITSIPTDTQWKTQKTRHNYSQVVIKGEIRSEVKDGNKSSTDNSLVYSTINIKTKIKITETLSISAINVDDFKQVRQNGELYYIANVNHFAVRIAGMLLHGNIGIVYTDEKNPVKIKDCKFADKCTKQLTCDYYHDPYKYGGKDHRNYIASSFLYCAHNNIHNGSHNGSHNSSHNYTYNNTEYKLRPHGRRYGSLDNLDIDIVNICDSDISRYQDQTMHDLLCNLIISQMMQENNI